MSRNFLVTFSVAAALAAMMLPADAQQAKRRPAQPPIPLLAQACAGCHGQNGEGQRGTPILAHYDRAAFIRTWAEFRNNRRPAASIMPRIARGYSDAEVAILADYFSSIPR